MTIPFKNIPSNLRLPLFYAEVDNSQANSGQLASRAVIIAQITSSGVATPNIPIISQGVNDAITQGGPGSMLALMVSAYRAADSFGELWLLPVADNGAGTAATGNIAFTSAATQNGTLNLYIGGVYTPMAISSSQTTAQIATALAALINANTNLPVTAAVDGTNTFQVDFTAKNKGLNGNFIDVRTNYAGAAGGQSDPAGLAYTITQLSGGTANPILTTALANLSTQKYDVVISPYTDSTSLTAVTAYLNDQTGTWSWDEQFYGHAFMAARGTFGSLVTLGNGMNDQHSSILGFFDSPTPPFVVAADFGATCAVSLRADPATPLHTLALSTMLPPPLASRFPATERNTLLFDGISTFTVDDSGLCRLEGTITTYQKNAFNQPDNSYLQINTMFNLASVLQQLAAVVTSQFARVKLAADGTKFADGSNIVTPSTIKASLVAQYQEMEFNGQVQGSAEFAAGLIVQQNANNPNRVDVLWDGILIDQLDIFALLAQFRLTA